MRKLYINGVALENVVIGDGFSVPISHKSMDTLKVPGRDGEVPTKVLIDGTDITIPLVYRNRAAKHNPNEIRRKITEWLSSREEVEIHIDDTDFYWNAWIIGNSELRITDRGFQEFSVTFKLTDPFKYSKTIKKSEFVRNSAIIDNKGTEHTPFVFVGTALESIPFFHIGLHDENLEESQYDQFLIGNDTEDNTIKNYSPKLLVDEFRSSVGYSRMGETESVPGFLGGTTGASLKQNPQSWALNESTIKQKSGWRGMGYLRQYDRAVSDFRNTYKIAVHHNRNGRSKIAQHIYDTNGRIQFSMGYSKTAYPSDNGTAYFLAYNESGQERVLWKYVLPPRLKRVKNLVIYFRMERVGTTIRVRIWAFDDNNKRGRIEDTKLVDINRVYKDTEKYYQRDIASVRFTTFRGNRAYRYVSHLGVYSYELLPKPQNASDYIIKQGDEIVLNTKDKHITVNGEPMLYEKDFFSNYFKLKPGISHLAISPVDKIKGHVEYQERWS